MKIYYFSGSGNSYYVAKKMSESLGGELIDIAAVKDGVELSGEVGFVVPCYAFGIPDIAAKFLKKFQNKSTYSFFILTYAGYYGGTFKQVKTLISIDYNCGVKMPGSDMVFYRKDSLDKRNELSEKNEKIYQDADKKIDEIVSDLKDKKDKKISRAMEYFLILPIYKAAMWYFRGAKRGFKTNEKCTLCRFCEKICPVDNIKVGDKVIWDDHCEGCLRCINYCPFEAIEYKKYTRGKVRFQNKRIDISQV